MAKISHQEAGINVVPFLDMLAVSELTKELLQNSDDGYNVLVGSTPDHPILFDSYEDHPDRLMDVVSNGVVIKSTAAGRYQILHTYWPHYKEQLNLPDFGPMSQDLYTIQQLREHHAIPFLHAGKFKSAVKAVSHICASLPGAGYANQHENKMDSLLQVYLDAGGTNVE